MRPLLLLLVTAISALTAHAQQYTISGYVRDSLSGEPLIGVTVAQSPTSGTATNTYGFYSLTLKSPSTNLTFRYIGYKELKKKVIITQDTSLDIFMEQQHVNFNSVKIVANTTKHASVRNLGSVKINSEQLKYVPLFLGEKDIFKYFQLQPGVSAGKEGSTGMSLRGGSTDQTLILMDDIPIYNHSHAFGFVSIFSGDYIKSAELYKGYVPPTYGGRLSGVATMNIREGNRKEHKQSLQLGTTTISGLVEGPINKGKGSYLVGGRYFTPHLLLSTASLIAEAGPIPVFGFYDATAKLSYDLGKKNTIYASFYTGRDSFSTSVHDKTDDYDSRSKGGLAWGNMVGSLRLSSQLSNKTFLNTTVYYSHLSNKKNSEYKEVTEAIDLESRVNSQMGELGVKMNFDQNVNDWYRLSYGVNFAYQHFTPQEISLTRNGFETNTEYGTRNLLTTAGFVNNKFTAGKFNLDLGGRVALYNNNNENLVVFEPRAALSYSMKKSSVWLSYVENTQPLFSMNQQYYNMPVDYWIPFQSANELPRSKQISLGYKHKFDFGLDLFAEVYYKKSDNISLVYNSDDFLLNEGGYELAKGDAYGAELMLQYSRKRFSIMASYAYSRSIYDINGRKVNFMFDTPHNFNVLTSYETLTQVGRKHTLSMNIGFKTGLPYILSNEVYPSADNNIYTGWHDDITNNPQYPNKRLNNFFRMDLNYTMEKKLKHGSRVWQISLLNATGHKNPYIVYPTKGGYKAMSLIPILPSFSYIRYF